MLTLKIQVKKLKKYYKKRIKKYKIVARGWLMSASQVMEIYLRNVGRENVKNGEMQYLPLQ